MKPNEDPSAFDGADIESAITGAAAVSLFVMVELALAVPIVAFEGFEILTVNDSSGSTAVSFTVEIVIEAVDAFAAKVAVPVGSAPPVKSVAFAAPVTA